MYIQKHKPSDPKITVCPECGNSRLQFNYSKITCTNCGHVIKIKGFNKYGAKKTEFNGKIYDSKFEASVASDLEMRKRIGDIKDYDTQFRLEVGVYDMFGNIICHKRHKVDFRTTNLDGSYTLIEAKGMINADYQWRRDIVVGIWLSEHKDYDYQVIKQNSKK
jgi:hypothetical protein